MKVIIHTLNLKMIRLKLYKIDKIITNNLLDIMTSIRTLPSIEHGNENRLSNIDINNHIIIDEKVDGSQLTINKQNGVLHFYNKNKEINGKGDPWLNAYLSFVGKEDMFVEGIILPWRIFYYTSNKCCSL